jgi:hypothetical protein
MIGAAFRNSILTLILLFASFLKGYSIGEINQVGARDFALANATVALASSFSAFNNQATMAFLNDFALALDYRQPYLIDRFAIKSLAITVPTPLSNFAFTVQQKGISGYNESRFGFAMAKKMGKNFSAGLQFNYFLVDFPEQGSNLGTFLIEFGVFYQPKNKLAIGFHLFNPSGAAIESLNFRSKLPVMATAGISIKPTSDLLIVSSMAYDSDKPFNIRMGLEYQVAEKFFVRGGVSGKPIRHSAGIGYKCRYFSTDVAFVHHETLGYTPSISLIFNF